MFRQSGFVAALLLLPWATLLAQQIPPGTVLPIMANTTLDSAKSKPGDKFSGKLMQDVVLPSGDRLRAGSRVEGAVVESTSRGGSAGARLVVRFDRVVTGDKQTPIVASLRSLASMSEVFNAQLPVGTFDEYGTSSSDWTTVQVGGAAVYRGDGTVRSAMDIVGRATDYGAVTAKLLPAPKLGCPATPTDGEQSLWIFSPWACGTYGFDDLTIAHHGNNPPVGTIELTSPKSVHVRGGSGWLLRVVASDPGTTHSPSN
jgi:hypothetical protein